MLLLTGSALGACASSTSGTGSGANPDQATTLTTDVEPDRSSSRRAKRMQAEGPKSTGDDLVRVVGSDESS